MSDIEPLAAGEYLFTSESVTEGHPDKVCDQISDAVLDAVMAGDPEGRVACETLVNTGMAVVSGEISTDVHLDVPELVRETIREIGYDHGDYGYNCDHISVLVSLDKQSPDIAQGVDESHERRSGSGSDDELLVAGAGDQGMMFGYATDETEALMPMPVHLAHRLAERLAAVRKDGTLDYLGPDGKTQVTVRYADGRPIRVEKLLISTQHADGVEQATIKADLWQHVVLPVLEAEAEGLYDEGALRDGFLVNPTGKFVIGGPVGDAGLTGRKIIVDTYGGMARHGGGAFSGKDPSKVDRSAAYATRYVAKNVVAAGLAQRCEVQVAYAIGVSQPVSLMVETFGTGKLPDMEISRLVEAEFDLRPGAFRNYLDLHRPIFRKTAAYGHFGREDADFTWEKTDRAEALKQRRRGRRDARLSRRLRLAEAVLAGEGAGRLINSVDHVRGLGDAAEDEVVVVGRGGVEVDVADPHHPLVDRLAVVDVLDALEAGLLDLARDDAALDVEPPVGDRVGRRDPLDEADQDGQPDHDEDDQEDAAAAGAEELRDHADDRGDQDPFQVEAEDRPPRGVALEDHPLAGAEVERHRPAGYPAVRLSP